MHPIYYLLALLPICFLLPLPTLAIETEDTGFPITTTSRHAVPTDPSSLPSRRRHLGGGPANLLRGNTRRSKSSDNTCPTDYTQCGSGLPSGFCCASGSSCLSLAGATTVLCCPSGEDCAQIEPITCNISVQNATAYPTLAVHTTNLTGQLPTCGSGCCPFGYTCSSSGGNVCVRTKEEDTLITATKSAPPMATVTSAAGTGTALVMASADATKSAPVPTGTSSSSSSSNDDEDDDGDRSGSSSNSSSAANSRTIGIAAGSAVAGLISIGAIIAFAWTRRRRAARPLAKSGRSVRVSVSQFSPTPPPLPEKEPHQVPKRKRKSLLSWVPSIINRTPAELPATPVSFSTWNTPWGQGQAQRPNGVLRPYPRDSLTIEEVHELEATWVPQERPAQERHTSDMPTQEWYTQQRYI